MSIKPDPRYIEELGRAVDRLKRSISIPGSGTTTAEVDAAQARYDDALLAALHGESRKVDVLADELAWRRENAARSVAMTNSLRMCWASTEHRQIRLMLRQRERITRGYANQLIDILARIGADT